MNFRQHVYIGLPWFGRRSPARDPDRDASPIEIRASSVDVAGDYAGSYHVLEMGRQYSAYVRYRDQRPLYRYSFGLPAWSPAQRLMRRNRAADVTGNIGEIVAGILARRTLGARASEIAHLEARQDGRTPYYLLVDSDGVRKYVSGLTGVLEDALPLHWPLESKAWSRGAADRDAIRDAVRQLAAYWLDTRAGYPEGVGHGIIVGLALDRPRTVNVYVLVPRDHVALLAWFDGVILDAHANYRTPRDELYGRLSGDGILSLTCQFKETHG
jgi:hypothetical protein